LRLIKPLPEDRARAHPFAGNGGSWRIAVVTCQSILGCLDSTDHPQIFPGLKVFQLNSNLAI